MKTLFRPMTAEEFAEDIASFAWTRQIWRVDMHHTWFPAHGDYRGLASIEGMARYHVETCGYDAIAQHVSIAPDGAIWTGRDWNMTPASVGFGMNTGVFMFEAIGNFDVGHDILEADQLDSVIAVIGAVQSHFHLPPQALLFHRDVPQTEKTCPGSSIEKADVLRHLRRRRPRQGVPSHVAAAVAA